MYENNIKYINDDNINLGYSRLLILDVEILYFVII